ncbi:hypothetical protein B0O80DRAFT_475392 [Mortierella sp. GBAus27b]|nr:hypothetical protein B0O80DRAFT_475392 [Mortierella sp. GBAus27b]
MDDFYHFMSPLEGANNNANDRPSTRREPKPTTQESAEPSTTSTADETASTSASRASWSAWGASFNKLIERGKKDMNEFVDVTRKDLTELVQTVQQEHSTAMESLSKKVGDLNSTSADILGRVSHAVEGIKHEITEAATGRPLPLTTTDSTETSTPAPITEEGSSSVESKTAENKDGNVADTKNEPSSTEATETGATATEATETGAAATEATSSSRGSRSSSLSFANTANFLSAGAQTLTQTLSSGTKEISSTANDLFKKKLPSVAEDADMFFKSTTETLRTNGLLAEQYVNKFGAGMANFLNSAVVISAPEAKEPIPRTRKMFFDRKAAILEKLRMDPATYTVDPMTTIADNDIVGLERYKYFLETFNIAEYQQRILRLLNEYPEVKALMKKLSKEKLIVGTLTVPGYDRGTVSDCTTSSL